MGLILCVKACVKPNTAMKCVWNSQSRPCDQNLKFSCLCYKQKYSQQQDAHHLEKIQLQTIGFDFISVWCTDLIKGISKNISYIHTV